ncbi:ADP-forming succinate--CoA ligase subunit beta [Corynebacterium lubricantis]|uniref:ADP-forming succinate--CoA ligase subunit beta n=1 Tax=Corynebacterium lubricantis TaxID=541095 RepID=UPI00036A3D27|nr:ADP-forming succinate--CoA ligase subunit beta [Corynebacterium lubricantis]
MDLYEHQARQMFEDHGVPVVPGKVATSATQAERAARTIGGPVVIKAQVKTGGRGKAGGVRMARDAGEAAQIADEILGLKIKGFTVRRVMVARAVNIAEEYYFSILLDRTKRRYLAMLSREGGVEIETLAVEKPEALVRRNFSPLDGFTDTLAREMAEEAGFDEADTAKLVPVLKQLYSVYDEEDATLVEVNPLVKTASGEIIALDGKITLDDNADFRHPEHAQLADHGSMDPLEAKATNMGLNYVKLDGSVGVIGNGAGLVMSTLDVVADAGADLASKPTPANFLDIGGGANADVMANGLEVILEDLQVRSIFVNVFGGITACDEVAKGIVQAYRILKSEGIEPKPLVVRLDGNNAEEGKAILNQAQLPLGQVDTMDAAARKAAELADANGGL